MNEHQKRLWKAMIELTDSYINDETEDFFETVGNLEGALDASEIKDDALIYEWYDFWGPLEIIRAVHGNNVDKSQAKCMLKDMQQFLLSKEIM